MMMKGDMWSNLGSTMAAIMFMYAMFRQYFPPQLQDYIFRYSKKLSNLMYPYIHVTFDEFTGERMKRSEAFSAIQNYLSGKSSAFAKRLKADVVKDSQSLVLSMDYDEEITDEFKGVKVWWAARRNIPKAQQFSIYPSSDEKRYYILKFHKRDREFITGTYLIHVLKQGKAIAADNRQRKLYSNNPGQSWSGYRSTKWSHVVFEHPATFDTLAMDAKKKEEIKKDLIKFSKGKEYYAKIGKAWKRGYLLYGPPGTGKSTMIAAMANFLNYDVYDLELTTVKNNIELRRLLIETSNKSIIVIEDIDCSLDLTGQREKKKKKDENEEEMDPISKKAKEEEQKDSEVTLSGLLNFIDGLWSACGGERIIVFTTNYVEKLDPALIRRGRMDKHIEMSYCRFEAFKVLAKNYLDIELHPLFGEISSLLEETDMTPADVAENLMLKSDDDEEDETCLKNLIEALKDAKEEARKKAEEEARLKAEKEEKEKEQAEKEEKEKEQSVREDVKEDATAAKEVKENGVIH
ncbi:P-loop containing nucleoside triphosphate hydrolases superfamily protein [Theobroma cacao]|uniref:P-loop containing nucleoside triphosphate hydrolases superfamily protein n=1 Tax=Theobroma cacao TaxID=3641 RepID=A0A061EEH5_THECC|nr:P-loop containing nucleoside triphosphate hydrolases superfamily protein [Theobroma cacao]